MARGWRRATTAPAASPVLERRVAWALVAIAMCFGAWFARFEWTVAAPDPGDRVLHVLLASETAHALSVGADPTDHWVTGIGAGFAVPHHYYHGGAILCALLHRACGGLASPAAIVAWCTWLAVVLWPWALYRGGRRLGLTRLAAASAALLGPLASSPDLFGLEYSSVCAGSHGLFGQALGLVLMPFAIGEGVCALRTGRHVVRAAAWLATCGLCHLLSGYVAAASLVFAALVTPSWPTWRRLGVVAGLAAAASAYHWSGIVIDGAAMNPSVVQRDTLPLKFTSLGHLVILRALFTGALFDHGRLPTLTLLVALGVALAITRRREAPARTLLILGAAWLALYFGRPTWGGLMDWLPFGSQLHLHRFVIGVHLAGAWLAGMAGGVLLRWALAAPAPWWRAVACVGLALLPLPAHRERAVTLGWFHRWQQETADAWREQGADVEGAIATIAKLPPGRVFAGLPTTWGTRYAVGHQPVYAAATQAGLDTLGYLYHDFSYTGDLFPSFNDVHQAQYRLFNVRYVLVPAGTPIPDWYRLRGQFGAQALYEVETDGYCSLVDSDLDAHGPPITWYAGATAWVRTGAVDYAQHPRMHIGAPVTPDSVPFARIDARVMQPHLVERSPRGQVLTELVAPGTYAADVDAARACWLMCRVSWHPNWHATVDGQPVTPTMLAPAYLGVPVTPGRHHIQFTYVPRWYRKWLLLLGLASLAGAAWWRHRRRPSTLTAPAQPVPSGPTEHP